MTTPATELFVPASPWLALTDLPNTDDYPPQIATFLYQEAALLDTGDLDKWLSLFTDDAIYWVPLVHQAQDPGPQINLIYDNPALLEDRVYRLQTGEVPSQDPPSRTARLITNITTATTNTNDILTRSTFILTEHRRHQTIYTGHYTHRLRPTNQQLQIAAKKTELTNSDTSLPSLTFLL
jgi:3-phenylpropionate/cinnamic acid dioxygenase small subunit